MMLAENALPSCHYEQGMRALKLEWAIDDCRHVCAAADDFQRALNPGKPSTTMAAFLYAYLPVLGNSQKMRIYRSLKQISRAFDCSESAINKRLEKISRRDNAWKSR